MEWTAEQKNALLSKSLLSTLIRALDGEHQACLRRQ